MVSVHGLFGRIFEPKAASSDAKPPATPLTRFFDKPRNRIALTGTLSLLLLINIILAGTAVNATPNGVHGALAWQIVLSIGIWIYSLFLFWRNLDGCSEKRCTIFFWLNIAVAALWLTGFFSLAIELGQTPDSLNFKPDGKNVDNYKPEIGCLIFDLAFFSLFITNGLYVFTRAKQLFPKYAEIDEESQAFDARMTEAEHHGHGELNDHHPDDNHSDTSAPLQMQDNSAMPLSHTPPAGSQVEYNPLGGQHQQAPHDAYGDEPGFYGASSALHDGSEYPGYDAYGEQHHDTYGEQHHHQGGYEPPQSPPYGIPPAGAPVAYAGPTSHESESAPPQYPGQASYAPFPPVPNNPYRSRDPSPSY